MTGASVLLATMLLGVDYGWQPTSSGELEYIIQIEPEFLDSLQQGHDVVSEILPELRGVRRFRVRVGDGPVPREPQDPPAPMPDARDESSQGDQLITEESEETEQTEETEETETMEPAQSEPEHDFGPNKAGQPAARLGHPAIDADSATDGQQMTDSFPAQRPERLEIDPDSRPMDFRQAGYAQGDQEPEEDERPEVTSPSDTPTGGQSDGTVDRLVSSTEPKPWWPFTVSVIALFTSLGGNAYLAWVAVGFYRRYQALAQRVREADNPFPADEDLG